MNCGKCGYFRAFPNQAVNTPIAGSCYGVPPVNILIPVQAPMQAVLKAGQSAQAISLQSLRPSVTADDFACSLFQGEN